jgi:hypothetical protein
MKDIKMYKHSKKKVKKIGKPDFFSTLLFFGISLFIFFTFPIILYIAVMSSKTFAVLFWTFAIFLFIYNDLKQKN